MRFPHLKAHRRPLLAGTVAAVFVAAVVIVCVRGKARPFAQRPIEQEAQAQPGPQRPPEITVPDVPEAREWLDNYIHQKEQQQQVAQQQQQQPGQPQQPHGPSWLQQTMKSLTTVCGLPMGQTEGSKRYLLLATVGDEWNAYRWLSQPKYATFDVAVIYYGNNSDFRCDQCSDVFHMRGPKWHLYYNLTTSSQWELVVQRGYKYIMLPDDDLVLDTCQLNTFFSIMEEFDALMGQPSVCEREGSFTFWPMLYQRPQHRVRFTTFLEIMAPTFRLDLYQALIRHTMKGTYTGYGLDLVWPALLRYPEDKIAVVDQICMVHPPSPPGGKPGGLYELASNMQKREGNEMDINLDNFNYKPEVIERMGMEYRAMKSLKIVDNEAALLAVQDLEGHLHRDALYQLVIVVQAVALVGLVGLMGLQRLRSVLRLGGGMLRSASQEWKLAAWRTKYASS